MIIIFSLRCSPVIPIYGIFFLTNGSVTTRWLNTNDNISNNNKNGYFYVLFLQRAQSPLIKKSVNIELGKTN